MARQCPGMLSISRLGLYDSFTYIASAGSSIIPVSLPLSQWSHQRNISGLILNGGPGLPMPCVHCPMMARRGTDKRSSMRGMLSV